MVSVIQSAGSTNNSRGFTIEAIISKDNCSKDRPPRPKPISPPLRTESVSPSSSPPGSPKEFRSRFQPVFSTKLSPPLMPVGPHGGFSPIHLPPGVHHPTHGLPPTLCTTLPPGHLSLGLGHPLLHHHGSAPAHPMLGNHTDPLTCYPWVVSSLERQMYPRIYGLDPSSLVHNFRKPKRIRTAFTPSQLLRLEHAFEKNHYVVGQERKDLAANLNLTETQVKVWFQNRRTKHKRVKQEEEEETRRTTYESDSTTEESRRSEH